MNFINNFLDWRKPNHFDYEELRFSVTNLSYGSCGFLDWYDLLLITNITLDNILNFKNGFKVNYYTRYESLPVFKDRFKNGMCLIVVVFI